MTGPARAGRRLRLPILAAAGLCALLALAPPPASAQTVRALVVGIDAYAELPDLAGAVNDARDLAMALRGAGVTDLTVLENAGATRTRIVAEWRALVARSARGDTLVLSYAGHGGQEPARRPGTERDGKDEVLLLGGFRSAGPGTRERILDDELNRWFAGAGERGLRVVFVADACHSGTLTRSVDPRAPPSAVRMAQYTIDADELVLDLPEDAARLREADLPHVSFLAAGQEHEQVPEVVLPDAGGAPRPRGALSYMVARAIEGQADLDGDGVLRRAELWRFVRENVRMVSGSRQMPNLLPAGRGAEPVLRLDPDARPDARPDTPAPGGKLRLAVLNAGDSVADGLRARLSGVAIVPAAQLPDLVWDAKARQLVTGLGDVAAHGVDAAALPAAVGKWQAVRRIRAFSARDGLTLRVLPHDGVHRRGSRLAVEVAGVRARRLTLIGLSGDGTVHYLYPQASESVPLEGGGPFRLRLDLKATPPFGADHVVAVSADSPLDALDAALARLDGTRAARRAARLLASARAGSQGWQSGIQGLFTAP